MTTETTTAMTYEQACDILRPKKAADEVTNAWGSWGSGEQKRAVQAWKSSHLPEPAPLSEPSAAPLATPAPQVSLRPRLDMFEIETLVKYGEHSEAASKIDYCCLIAPEGLEARALATLSYAEREALDDNWASYTRRQRALKMFLEAYRPLVVEHLVMEAWLNPDSGLCRFIKQGLHAYEPSKQLLFRTPPNSLSPGIRVELIAFLSTEYEAMERGVPRGQVGSRRKR